MPKNLDTFKEQIQEKEQIYYNKTKKQCHYCNGYGVIKTNVEICEGCNGNKCIRCNSTGLSIMPYSDCTSCDRTGEIFIINDN